MERRYVIRIKKKGNCFPVQLQKLGLLTGLQIDFKMQDIILSSTCTLYITLLLAYAFVNCVVVHFQCRSVG